MEKSKYANISLILALISLIGPLISILTFLEIIPKVSIFGIYAVSGMTLLCIILGILGWKETEQKWKLISAFVISILGLIITYAIGTPIVVEVIYDMFPTY